METLNLTGRKGLVVGIANEHSLAWSAAQHFHNAGADFALLLVSDYTTAITGEVLYVDAGFHIEGMVFH